MKLIYIIGKSSSGKDTIFNILKKELNVNTYVMYTTRPQRDGEIDGITYNFVTDEKMKEYINGKGKYKVIEYRLKDIDVHIELTDQARDKFIEEGYDINFGARPLKRLVGRTLEVDLSRLLIEGEIKEHDTIIVNYVNDRYIIKKKI